MKSSIELEVLWEVPLGVLSYGFSRVLKASLTLLSRYYNPANTQAEPEWQVVSADFLKSPIKLVWTMSRARWNLHSLIAIAGPFTVERTLTLDTRSLSTSAQSWTAVIYTLKGYQTITSISSLKVPPEQDWATLELAPGRYLVGLRHYQWSDPIQLPAIQVDGELALASQPLAAPPDFNRFYRDLIHRRAWIHGWMNFYVYPLLRYQRWLPQAFVKDTFLPVPNPETQFYYGAVNQGETVTLDCDPSLLTTHHLFFSVYSRDCFPLDWYPITTSHHVTQPWPEKGAYILRVHPKDRQNLQPSPVQVAIAPAN